jgi:hypothetical protein
LAVSVVLVLLGLVGSLTSWGVLADAVDHGEGAAVVLLGGVGLVLALTQIRNGVVIFLGHRGGRGLAATICVINLLGAVVVLAAGAPLGWLGVIVNTAVIAALIGDTMANWCDRE